MKPLCCICGKPILDASYVLEWTGTRHQGRHMDCTKCSRDRPAGTIDENGHLMPAESVQKNRASREKWKLCPLCNGQGEIHKDSYPVNWHPSHYWGDAIEARDKEKKERLKQAFGFLDKIWMGIR